jgi:hypothetical protein
MFLKVPVQELEKVPPRHVERAAVVPQRPGEGRVRPAPKQVLPREGKLLLKELPTRQRAAVLRENVRTLEQSLRRHDGNGTCLFLDPSNVGIRFNAAIGNNHESWLMLVSDLYRQSDAIQVTSADLGLVLLQRSTVYCHEVDTRVDQARNTVPEGRVVNWQSDLG